MTLYPKKPNAGQRLQTHVPGTNVDEAFLAHLVFANPGAGDVDIVLAAVTLNNGSTKTVSTGFANPDVPRALSITGNQAGITGNVVVNGLNEAGEVISETLAANGTATVNGNKAFKAITSAVFPARNGAGDTISIGVTEKLGLPYKLAQNTVFRTFLNNILEGTSPTVAVSATALESNTIDLNSALDGHQVDVYLMV